MTLDFVRDILKKMDKQKMEYFLITMRPGKEEHLVDVNSSIKKDSREIFASVLLDCAAELEKGKKK